LSGPGPLPLAPRPPAFPPPPERLLLDSRYGSSQKKDYETPLVSFPCLLNGRARRGPSLRISPLRRQPVFFSLRDHRRVREAALLTLVLAAIIRPRVSGGPPLPVMSLLPIPILRLVCFFVCCLRYCDQVPSRSCLDVTDYVYLFAGLMLPDSLVTTHSLYWSAQQLLVPRRLDRKYWRA